MKRSCIGMIGSSTAMKRLAALFLIISLLAGLTACSPGSGQSNVLAEGLVASPNYPEGIEFDNGTAWQANRAANPVGIEMKNAIDTFSYKTAAPILKASETNSCYSPLSLYFALALSGTGAKGQTQSEVLTLLGESDPDKLSREMGNLYRRLYTDNAVTRLKIGNSLWLDHEFMGKPVQYKDAFIKNATAQFYASLFKVDFAKPSAGEEMAKWISEQTNGTLTPRFDPDPQLLLSIINTVYFKGEWVDRFETAKTRPDTFHVTDSKDVTCDFMNMTNGSQRFSRGDGFTRAALNLKSNAQMVFVLPDKGVSIQELVSSPDRLRALFEGGGAFNGKVIWKIPKFSYDSGFELADTLKNLGVRSAFEPNADFSGITDHQAFISGITQKTHIAIDENGVEASAFTKVYYAGAAMPTDQAEMILDRPFLYAIFSGPVAVSKDAAPAQPGSPLFIGICGNPAE